MSNQKEEPKEGQRKWFKSLFKTGFLIGISKVIGFLRDLIVSLFFGTGVIADAFNYASLFTSLPFILLGGLNGPFHSATVAGLAQEGAQESKENKNEQNKLLSQALFWSMSSFCLLCLVFLFLCEPVINFLFKGNEKLITETIVQFKLSLPTLAFTGVIGILFGAVSFAGNYICPSISPSFSGLSIILLLFGFASGDTWKALALGLGVSIGTLIQVLVQFTSLLKTGFRFDFSSCFKFDKLANFNHILLPSLLSSTIGNLSVYIDMFFCRSLAEGSWTALLLGNRLIQLPFGVLVGASLLSFLPRISLVKDDKNKFKQVMTDELINLYVLLLPMVSLLLALSKPIIQVLLQRGNFTESSTDLLSPILMLLSITLITALPREIGTRGFYALGDSKTPFKVGILAIILNFLFNWLLVGRFDANGIAISKILTSFLSSFVLLALLKKNYSKGLSFFEFFLQIFRSLSKLIPSSLLGLLIYFQAKFCFDFLINISFIKTLSKVSPMLDLGALLALCISAGCALGIYLFFMLYLRKRGK